VSVNLPQGRSYDFRSEIKCTAMAITITEGIGIGDFPSFQKTMESYLKVRRFDAFYWTF